MPTPLETLQHAAERDHWRVVPQQVAQRYKEARPIAEKVRRITTKLTAPEGYGYVFWHPKKKALHAVLGPANSNQQQTWSSRLKPLPGVESLTIAGEDHPENPSEWVLIKKASGLSFLGAPFRWGGALTGGPSPLSNALVGSLLTGGLGYGAGWLLEHLLPERYLKRGKLRKQLGLGGLAAGAAPGLWQSLKGVQQADAAGKPMSWGQSWLTPTEKLPLAPSIDRKNQALQFTAGPQKTAQVLDGIITSLAPLPPPSPSVQAAAEALGSLVKAAGAGGAGLRSVPMDAFNRAIWNDVRPGMTASKNPFGSKSVWGDNTQEMHTPPPVAAAASGLVSGLSAMYGGRSVLSPMHFVRGLASAGVDVATARLVGGTLGALGGLTPEAQRKIQDVGLWGGMLRGAMGSLFR